MRVNNRVVVAIIAFHIMAATVAFGQTGESIPVLGELESGAEYKLGEFDKDIERIDINTRGVKISDPIVDIHGLEAFPDLRRLGFYLTPQIRKFSFLSRLPHIEQLLVSHSDPESVDFIQDLVSLRILLIQYARTWGNDELFLWPEEPFDLSEHTQLEFLGLTVLNLSRFPRFTNVPESLKYVDLSYNDLEITRDDIPWLEELRSVDYIFLYQNEVESELLDMFPNITMRSDPHNVYPEYWLD